MKMYISQKILRKETTPFNVPMGAIFMHNPTVICVSINVQKALSYHIVKLVILSNRFNIRSALLKNSIMNLYDQLNQLIVCTLAKPEPKLRIVG